MSCLRNTVLFSSYLIEGCFTICIWVHVLQGTRPLSISPCRASPSALRRATPEPSMTELGDDSDPLQRKKQRERRRDKQIMRTLRCVLQVQKDVRELLHGVRASIDSVLLQHNNKEGSTTDADIEEVPSTPEDEKYETGVVEPLKTDPAKSRWRDLAAAFNAAAELTKESEGKKKANTIYQESRGKLQQQR